jgi:hypothetical protein
MKYLHEGEKVYLPGTDQAVGVTEGGTFHRAVMGSLHRFRRRPGPGWALDLVVFQALKGEVETIRVVDMETDVEYTTPYWRFENMGRKIQFGDYGQQLLLNLRYWETVQLEAPDEALKELL